METYSFPSITVKAGGFKVIFLSNDDQGGVYASFSLSSGDTLAIYDRGGKLVDQVVVTTKESSTHLGRFPDGGEWVELSRFSITPSAPNRFLTAFEHTYHDVCRDTVMINGFLMNRAHFSKNEQGVLTVSRSKVEADDSIDADLKKSFLASLPEGGDAEAVSLADWLAQNSGKKTITVYYVPTLGSYICYML